MIVYILWQFYSHCVTSLQNEYMDRWTGDTLESERARGSFCDGSRVPDDEIARLLVVLQTVMRSGILRIDSNVTRYLEPALENALDPSVFQVSTTVLNVLVDLTGFSRFLNVYVKT